MVKVTFKNKNIAIEIEENKSLVDAIRLANLSIETACSGNGSCGKCKIKAIGNLSLITEKEKSYITKGTDERLACVTRILGDVEVELSSRDTALKTINTGYSIDININSDIKRIKLPEIKKDSSIPYIYSLEHEVSYEALKKLSQLNKSNIKDIDGVIYNDKIIDYIQVYEEIIGVALDIGTTGISAYLINLENGEILNKKSSLNPQTEYGGDVLSRITYSMNNLDGKEKLKKVIIDKINEIILELLENTDQINKIYRVSISANTVMLHMLLGIDTKSMSIAPYRAEFLNEIAISADDIGIEINKSGIVTILPSASSYVGADIISGAIATGFNKNKHNSVFIDIGTNGEILVVCDHKIIGTSTAAGPAFEGMNITHGCRAESGAIDTFEIINDEIKFTTINNQNAVGICGSGLIDIVSELIKHKVILKSGKLNNKLQGKLAERMIDKSFYITETIYISQKDIRQVQLAKGSISAGVIMLLDSIELSIDDIEEIIIAGAFGYHMNIESIKTIGIIPKGYIGKISFVGNSSIEGARLSLVNKDMLNEMIKLKDEIEVLELSMKESFQECFIKQLSF